MTVPHIRSCISTPPIADFLLRRRSVMAHITWIVLTTREERSMYEQEASQRRTSTNSNPMQDPMGSEYVMSRLTQQDKGYGPDRTCICRSIAHLRCTGYPEREP